MRPRITAPAAIAAIFLLAGCSVGAQSGSSTESAPDSQPYSEFESEPYGEIEQAPTPADGGQLGSGDGSTAEEGAAAGTPDDPSRAVIARGSLFVTVADPLEAAAEAVRIVEQAGGRIDRRSERPAVDGDGGYSSAELTVRIPST